MKAYRQGSHMVCETDHFSLYVIVEQEHIHSYKQGVCEGCGMPDPDSPVAVVVTGTGTEVDYKTLDTALQAAAFGDTVLLLRNTETHIAAIPEDVTLDLNGYVLKTQYITCFGNIVDSSRDNTGLLKVDKTKVLIQSANAQIPVRDLDGYRFVEIRKFNQLLYAETSKLVFQPLLEEASHLLLLQGSEKSGITIGVNVFWQQDQGIRSQNFIYNDSLVSQYLRSYAGSDCYSSMFTLTLNGSAQLKNLTFQIVVQSECGVEYLSDPLIHSGTDSN